MVNAEPLERGGERRHAGSRIGRILAVKVQRVIEGYFPRAAPVPQRISTSVQNHLLQPCVEPGVVTELRKVAPGRHERLLDDIMGIGLTAEDRRGGPKGVIHPGRHQGFEGADVALSGACNQILVTERADCDAVCHVHTTKTSEKRLALGWPSPTTSRWNAQSVARKTRTSPLRPAACERRSSSSRRRAPPRGLMISRYSMVPPMSPASVSSSERVGRAHDVQTSGVGRRAPWTESPISATWLASVPPEWIGL